MSQDSALTDLTGTAAKVGGGNLEGVPEKGTGRATRFQFLSTVGFSFAIVALQMGQGILLARLLGPGGRGEYATAVLYAQLLLYVGLFGGAEVICRHAANGAIPVAVLRRAAMWLGITTGVITSLIAVFLSVFALPEAKRFLIPMAVFGSLGIAGQHIMLMMTSVDRGRGHFGAYNIRRLIGAGAFPVLLLATAIFVPVDVVLATNLYVIASLIAMGACFVGTSEKLRGESQPAVPALLKESRPYAFSMLVNDLVDRMDLVLVLWLVPLVEQGLYAAMVPVVYPLTVIPNTLGIFLFNEGARQDSQLKSRDVNRILGSSLAVQTASTIAFMLVIGPLVVFLYGAKFEPAIVFAFWLAPVSAIRGILQGLDSYLKGRGKPLAPIRARLVAMVVMIVVTWGLFDRFGAVAIAMAALAGQVVCFAWLTVIVYADVNGNPEIKPAN
ncbi:MAG: lipopolysaccharide biosynthesis protein [Rubripirellula sp.]